MSKLSFLAPALLLAAACVSQGRHRALTFRSAELTAAAPPPAAQAPESKVVAPPREAFDPGLSAVVMAVALHRDTQAVAVADRILALSPEPSPWLAWIEYYRAVALTDLRQTDAAVGAYEKAAARFAEHGANAWGRSIALYGKARALNDAYRCVEARKAYADYADFVRAKHPHDAAMAVAHAGDCK